MDAAPVEKPTAPKLLDNGNAHELDDFGNDTGDAPTANTDTDGKPGSEATNCPDDGNEKVPDRSHSMIGVTNSAIRLQSVPLDVAK